MARHHARRGEPFELTRQHLSAARSAKVHRSLIDFGELICLLSHGFLSTNARGARQPSKRPLPLLWCGWLLVPAHKAPTHR